MSYCIEVDTKAEVGIAVFIRFLMFGDAETRVSFGIIALRLCAEWLITLFLEKGLDNKLDAIALDLFSPPRDYKQFLLDIGFQKQSGHNKHRLLFPLMPPSVALHLPL